MEPKRIKEIEEMTTGVICYSFSEF
ncbi:hypothetical protein [Clostridium phoceensis]